MNGVVQPTHRAWYGWTNVEVRQSCALPTESTAPARPGDPRASGRCLAEGSAARVPVRSRPRTPPPQAWTGIGSRAGHSAWEW